jgi:hypothetical protein
MTPQTNTEFIAASRAICAKLPGNATSRQVHNARADLTYLAHVALPEALDRLEAAEKKLAESRAEARRIAEAVRFRYDCGRWNDGTAIDESRRILSRAEKDGGGK